MAIADLRASVRQMARVLIHYGVKAARRPRVLGGVDVYQRELVDIYSRWADELITDLAGADEDEREEMIAAALALLLTRLRDEGRRRLTEAAEAGAGELTDEAQELLDDAVAANDDFLESSLIPALRERIETGIAEADLPDLGESLDAFDARVGLYAGAWWTLYHHAYALRAEGKVTAYLDPLAKHCNECPEYQSVAGTVYDSMQDYLDATGDRMPGEFECVSNCRCWIV